MLTPRPYQLDAEQRVYAAWQAGCRVPLLVLPTGAGKTFVFSRIACAANGWVVVIAHRAELVLQMSVALARQGARHRIIGPTALQRLCAAAHLQRIGTTYVEPSARVVVASVDTLLRMPESTSWFQQVALWVMDEAHHVLRENKWGKAVCLFPNARGLGVTATPVRADGKGLGAHADGVADALIVGPDMRSLINAGFLTDYRIYAVRSDFDGSAVPIGSTGDFNATKLREARHRSRITGDVVATYLKHARGKLGVTFDVDIESATATAQAYRDAGVPAQVISSETPDALRVDLQRQFERREILQLVNVDLFGEGYDLPAIESVHFARPTASYALFAQQFGRALRLLDGKQYALIFDHVGNVVRHGLPDAPRAWSLDGRERGTREKPSVALRACLNPTCMNVFERFLSACPYCGEKPPVAGRSTPEQVEGDLTELSPDVLAALRAEKARIDGPVTPPYGASDIVARAVSNRHQERQKAQRRLRGTIALYAGYHRERKRCDADIYRAFWHQFGADILTAQTLNASAADELDARVRGWLDSNNIVERTA